MDSMTRHFGLKKVVSGFFLVFDSHPCYVSVNCLEGMAHSPHWTKKLTRCPQHVAISSTLSAMCTCCSSLIAHTMFISTYLYLFRRVVDQRPVQLLCG